MQQGLVCTYVHGMAHPMYIHTYMYIVTGNTCVRTILLPLDTDDDRVVPFSPAGLASCVQGGVGTAALQLR